MLYAWSASFGPRIWSGPKVIYHYHIWKVQLDESKVNKNFLCYWFGWDSEKIRSEQGTGTTMIHVTKGSMEDRELCLPPLSEQKRIVAILDEAFGAIARAKENAARNLANARELFDSYLNRVFTEKGEGWEEKKLSEIAKTFGRGKSRHRPRNDKSLYGGEYPFIQTGEIRNANHYITKFTQTYNEKGLAQSKLWPVGTLCITIAANIAETAILTFDACIPDSVIGLVCDPEKANVDFVEYLLQNFKSGLQAEGKGSAQDNINMGTFERMLFPFPSVSEQEKIVCELNAIAESCNNLSPIYQQKLTALDELKQSLLQKAFTGQLTSKTKELELVP